MQKTGGNVEDFIAAVTPAKRRTDAETVLSLMREVTGREPEMWGTIVGFGSCHYKYPTGNEGDMPLTAFAPRKQATTIYLLDAESHSSALERLGPHTVGRSCLTSRMSMRSTSTCCARSSPRTSAAPAGAASATPSSPSPTDQPARRGRNNGADAAARGRGIRSRSVDPGQAPLRRSER